MKTLSLAALLLLVTACATRIPNSQLQETLESYQQAQQNKALQQFKPAVLADGQQWLKRAIQLQDDNEPAEGIGHAAYMAGKLLDIAKEQAMQQALAQQQQGYEQQLAQLQQQQYEESVRLAQEQAETKARKKLEAEQRAAAALKSQQEAYQQALDNLGVTAKANGFSLSMGDEFLVSKKTDLTSSGEAKVDQLAEFLIHYPQHKIEIQGFSNLAGAEAANLKEANSLAQNLYRALLSRAILPERMSFKGFSKNEAQPVLDKGQRRLDIRLLPPTKK